LRFSALKYALGVVLLIRLRVGVVLASSFHVREARVYVFKVILPIFGLLYGCDA